MAMETSTDQNKASTVTSHLPGPDESGLSFVKRKLVTHEDFYHMHKTLGILCLLSYLWRFTRSWHDDVQMGFLSHPHLTVPTILMHLSLNAVSFVFHIPARRIKDGGRIWPEYRLHAVIFLLRSCLAILVRHYFHFHLPGGFHDPSNLDLYYRLSAGVVFLNMLLADGASYSVGDKSSDSIRGLGNLPVMGKYYFSIMQFLGTAFVMCSKNVNEVWFYAFVVQINPFGMTLVRKNVISHTSNMILYSFELFLAFCIGYSAGHHDPQLNAVAIVALFAAIWRMGPWPAFVPRHKYLVWAGTYVLFQTKVRPMMEAGDAGDEDSIFWLVKWADSEAAVLVTYAMYKQWKENRLFGVLDMKLNMNMNMTQSPVVEEEDKKKA